MPVELALYQPDIAQNTGTLLRLGACLGVRVHIIHPTGFPFSRRELKRGGLDYLEHADIVEHDSYAHFDRWRREAGRRLVLLTTKASESAYECGYAPDDILHARAAKAPASPTRSPPMPRPRSPHSDARTVCARSMSRSPRR
ncbi:MAG: TrmH family RNA methyltransferase [Ferruginibacter sp.]